MEYDIELESDEADGALEVPLESEGPEEQPFIYDEDSVNLVHEFALHPKGKEALKEISEHVCDSFQTDWDATEEYRKRYKDDLKLFTGELPAKDFPWKDCANAHVPILLENISRLFMRSYSELFGDDWQNVCGVKPLSNDPVAERTAEILSMHSNWQFRNEIIDMKEQQWIGLLGFFMIGDVTCHSYYDPARKRNRHVMHSPEDFIIPYVHTTTMPDLSDVPHYTMVMHLYKHEMQARRGDWYDVDKVLKGQPPSWSDEPGMDISEEVARLTGKDKDDAAKDAPYTVLWFEGWLDLPNQTDQRWCQVLVEKASKCVLKLTIHEEPDWQDKARHDRETAELTEFRTAEAAFAEQQALQAMMPPGAMPMPDPMADPMAMPPLPPAPPVPPSWLEDPSDPMAAPAPVKMVPIRLFRHGRCLSMLKASLGLGYGRVQADYNRVANTALNQFLDAATRNNATTILAAGGFKMDDITMAPGKIHVMKGMGGADLKNALLPLQFPPANGQLIEMVKLFENFGQSSMQSPGILSGEPGKSGETYRGVSARIEQATKQLSVITRRYADFFEGICLNNAKLNARFLPDEQIIAISDLRPSPDQITVGRHLYQQDYKWEIKADLRFATQAQRVAEADEIVMMSLQNPILMTNPLFLFHATKKALEARGRYDLVPLMGEAPPPPPPPGMGPPMPGGPVPPEGSAGPDGAPLPEGQGSASPPEQASAPQ